MADVPAGRSPAPSRCTERASRPWPGGVPPVARGLTSGGRSYQPPSEPLPPAEPASADVVITRRADVRRRSRDVAAMRGLSDKVAVVAGGAGGIGTASSLRLAEEGAAVVVGDLDGDAARGGRHPDQRGRRAGRSTSRSTSPTRHRWPSSSTSRSRPTAGSTACTATPPRSTPTSIGRDSDVETVPLDVFDRTIAVNLRGPLPVHAPGDPASERAWRRGDRVHRVGRGVHRRAGATVVRDRQERDHRAGAAMWPHAGARRASAPTRSRPV